MERWSRLRRSGLALALILLVFAASSFAQSNTFGRLAGTVFDSSGGVLPGASITITNLQTNQTQTTVANERGAFLFPQLTVGTYKVVIELQGFKTATYPNTVINIGQEYSITARLEIGQLTETVVVEGGAPLVQTTTPEVTKTVQQAQVLQLPLLNRDMTNLIRTSAGVIGSLSAARNNTGISGGRPSWTQVTQDGINVQDNFIRTNSVDFLPNRPTSDNVAEFSMTTSVSGADSAGGASSVRMITPSGSNTFRGSAFTTRRDSDWTARSYFDQKAGNPKPTLKRNQPGARLGGPIFKNKLFFFGVYEGWRQKTAGVQSVTIPANPDTFQGIFRYIGSTDGQVHSVDLLKATGMKLDSKMASDVLGKIPDYTHVNNTDNGDSKPGVMLNTAGYRYNQIDQNSRNYFTGRVDFELNSNHHFEGVYAYFRETDDRPDLDFTTPANQRPYTYTDAPVKRFAGAWRWLITPRLQNEVRGGANLAPVRFESSYQYGAYRFAGQTGRLPLNLNDPEVNFLPQGRNTNTYQINDNGSFVRGDHAIQFGASLQRIHVNPYNYEGTVPTITWGFSSAAPANTILATSQFPGGISATDLANAQTLLGLVTGTIQGMAQTFQVRDASSGYVPGYFNNRNYTLNNIASYIQDSWRVKPSLTLRAGLKWEYYSPIREDANLGMYPVLSGDFRSTLLSPTATLTLANGGLYNPDKNNFGPTVGFAYDPWKDGKTSIRGGYSLSFVNEETVTVGTGALGQNAGLATGVTLSGLYTNFGSGVPTVPTPTFKTTRTIADQQALSATPSIGMIDPNIRQPRVHQASIGIQRELGNSMSVEARYVGTFGRDIWKGVDLNQIQISNAFLTDFLNARSNGYLAVAAGKSFSPVYNSAITGSVPLTVLPNYVTSSGSTLYTGSTAVSAIQTGEVASLADYFVTQRGKNKVTGLAAANDFYTADPAMYQVAAWMNDGWQNYNAFILEWQRRYRNGFMASASYTFAHTTANSGNANGQNRLEPYLDNARPGLDAGRSAFNVTHNIKGNFIADLPFGDGKWLLNGKGKVVNAIVGNWQVSGIVNWQSGNPFGIYSTRGTFNRANRSGINGASTSETISAIQNMMGIYYQPDGRIFFINPSVVGSNGRAVGADNLANSAGFTGQLFYNPTAGSVGNLPVLAFDGPSSLQVDAALVKRFRIANRYDLEFRGEAFNLFNAVYFGLFGDANINSATFGRLTGVAVPARVVQLTARFTF